MPSEAKTILLDILRVTTRTLEFYADPRGYVEGGAVLADKGERARKARGFIEEAVKVAPPKKN